MSKNLCASAKVDEDDVKENLGHKGEEFVQFWSGESTRWSES